ncbi:hypothetical protein ASD89_01030 [Caulobacter sp. Root656]|nr:hypothetical protein ASD89_01030 [Caulobacter sp. Root656]
MPLLGDLDIYRGARWFAGQLCVSGFPVLLENFISFRDEIAIRPQLCSSYEALRVYISERR